jgi:hypothetical protein
MSSPNPESFNAFYTGRQSADAAAGSPISMQTIRIYRSLIDEPEI